MIPKFSDAVTIDWERHDFASKTVLTVRFCAAMQYHIEDGDEVEYEKIKDLVVEQLRLEVANSVGGMLATAERETLERRIDKLCLENEQLRQQNAKLRTFIDGLMFCHVSSAYDDCIGCPLLDQSKHNYRCTKTECMRDLGIEVDE